MYVTQVHMHEFVVWPLWVRCKSVQCWKSKSQYTSIFFLWFDLKFYREIILGYWRVMIHTRSILLPRVSHSSLDLNQNLTITSDSTQSGLLHNSSPNPTHLPQLNSSPTTVATRTSQQSRNRKIDLRTRELWTNGHKLNRSTKELAASIPLVTYYIFVRIYYRACLEIYVQ